MGKFANAVGVWELNIDDINFELKPKLGDSRKLLSIMMNEAYKKDSYARMEKFIEWLIEIIKRDYPQEDEKEIGLFVESNAMPLFYETLITFKYVSREDLDKLKKQSVGDIKKLIGED